MTQGPVSVLGLSCSPRRRGNTSTMLDSALAGASRAGGSVEKVDVPSLDIGPCRACNACFKTGSCVQKDDMQSLYPKLLGSDAVVLAAPIFSMNLAAQAKTLIDRLQCCWAKKFVLKQHTVDDALRAGRRGLWLSAAGMDDPTVFEPASRTVKYFFAMLEIKDWDRATFHNVDEEGAIASVPGALESCSRAGEWLVTGRAEADARGGRAGA